MTCLQIQFSTSKSNQLASRILSINGRAQNQEGNDTHGHSVHNPSPKILHRSISQKRAPRAKQSSPFQGPYWRPSSDAKTNGPQCPNPPLWPIRHGLRIILNLWIFEVFSHDIWRPSKRVCFFSLTTSFNDMEAIHDSQALDGFEAIEFSAHKGRSCASNFSLITLQPGPPFDQYKLLETGRVENAKNIGYGL